MLKKERDYGKKLGKEKLMMNTIDLAMKAGGQYILENGPELQRCLYRYHFQEGGLEPVLNALSAYQNEDGGFGHGLECDLQMPGSSILATSEALILLRSLPVPPTHPMIEHAVQYVLDQYVPDAKCWHFVPKEADQHPRAPWWNHDPDPRAARHNPRPQLLGDLCMARHMVADELLHSLAEDVRLSLLAESDSLVMHDLLSYLRLFRSPALPQDLMAALEELIPGLVFRLVERNPANWSGYCLYPFQVLTDMHDPLLPLVEDSLPASLQFLLDRQAQDGSWPTTWNWGDNYPEVWLKAQKEWQGEVTLVYLLTLKKFAAMVSS